MKATQDSAAETSGLWRSRRGRFLCACLVVAAIPALVYVVENWRGRRAWEKCKSELAAKGEAVEWSAFVPAPVPEEENIFKAPKMTNWFGGRGENELVNRFNRLPFEEYINRRHSNAVAEVADVSVVAGIGLEDLKRADLVLHYNCRVLSLAATKETKAKSIGSLSPIPLIQFAEVPLSIAIENLARQEGINYLLDPKVTASWIGPRGVTLEPFITLRWENLTTRRALYALLNTYGLLWIEDPETGIGRITLMEPRNASVYVVPETSERLLELTRSAIHQRLDAVPGPRLDGSQGYTFVTSQLPDARPRRVVVLTEEQLDTNAVAGFFPSSLGPGLRHAGNRWWAESTGSNSFRVFRDREPAFDAAEYLAWSDRFQPEFDLIREALQRPGVRLEDDYEKAGTLPLRNFVSIRYCSQTLAQRAQCHLLLGRPEEALRELTLIHELRRFLSGKPVTLVASMMDVAVAGLYVETLSDGLRLQAWREPELVALQQQLVGINLLPSVKAGFRYERAMVCQTLQQMKPVEFSEYFEFVWPEKPKPNWWKRNTNPAFLLLKFAPRGWVFQNLAVIAKAEQLTVEIINPDQQLVEPAKAAVAGREIERLGNDWKPYTALARRATPHFVRAASTLARNQTKANQALIACGLERYRRTHGEFPEALDVLVPQFVGKLPHDLIGGNSLKYQRTDDGKFLLYSIGWNEMDEGGKLAFNEDGSVGYDTPDWVWESAGR